MSANSIFDGPVTNLLSVLRILIEIFSRAHPKGGRGNLNDFKQTRVSQTRVSLHRALDSTGS